MSSPGVLPSIIVGSDLEEPEAKPDAWHYIGYGIAAVIFIPLGMWLKASYADQVGYFILSLGGTLY